MKKPRLLNAEIWQKSFKKLKWLTGYPLKRYLCLAHFYWVPCLSVISYIYFLLFSAGVSNIYHKYILPQIYIQIFFTFLMVCFQRLRMFVLVLFSLDYQSFPWWLLFCFSHVRTFCLMTWGSFSKLLFTLGSKIYLELVFEYGENYSFSVGLLFSSLNKFWFFFPEIFFFQIQIRKTLLFGMKFCTGDFSFSTLKMPLDYFCLPLFLLTRHL